MLYQLQDFKIVQFRKLRCLDLKGLGRINLLVGPNNSGKTSVLEAIACYCNPEDGYYWLETGLRRAGRGSSGSKIKALKWLFPQKSESSPPGNFEVDAITLQSSGEFPVTECYAKFEEIKAILPSSKASELQEATDALGGEFGGTDDGPWWPGARLQLRIELKHDRPLASGPTKNRQITIWDNQRLIKRRSKMDVGLPVAYITAGQIQSDTVAAEKFSAFRKLGLYDDAIAILRQIDPGIREVLVLSDRGNYGQLYIQHDQTGLTPSNAMGDGLRRALEIAMTIPVVKNGILLIDEIESALHVTVLTKVFELLVRNCREYNVQLFATTHSLEALDSILSATLQNNDPDLVLFRLESNPQKANAIRLDEKMLSNLRNELGQEVR